MRRNKYNAQRTVLDGEVFHSAAEAARFAELKLLERVGEITGLKRQPKFSLDVNGVHVCTYIADYEYHAAGFRVVEDKKGARTALFVLKKKLMKAVHGIDVLET